MSRRSIPKAGVLVDGSSSLRETPEGLEKLCRACHCWWPADTEFFSGDAGSRDGLFYRCKACYRDMPSQARRMTAAGRRAQPAPVALASVPWLGTQLFTPLIERTAP